MAGSFRIPAEGGEAGGGGPLRALAALAVSGVGALAGFAAGAVSAEVLGEDFLAAGFLKGLETVMALWRSPFGLALGGGR